VLSGRRTLHIKRADPTSESKISPGAPWAVGVADPLVAPTPN
jgi:hypothetical protein